jgi:NAD-dependent SIR2 family protein deacetylase
VSVEAAAVAIAEADAILIGAGAGMGVDSGLPDFRGDEGFWAAYPPMRHLNIRFSEMADPRWFRDDPSLAWGFYGHRLHLYRDTAPHPGFELLQRMAGDRPLFVFTSNVDGAFQRSGFAADQVYEVHGSLHHLQCSEPCSDAIWSAEGTDVPIDPTTFRASEPLPKCPRCGSLARPNVLMFGDWGWSGSRSEAQAARFSQWVRSVGRVAVLEFGAGTALPTVRRQCERVAQSLGTLVRVNPRESFGPRGTIELAMGAQAACVAIEDQLRAI